MICSRSDAQRDRSPLISQFIACQFMSKQPMESKTVRFLYITVARKLCLSNLYENIKIKGQIPGNKSLGKDLIIELNNLSLEAKNILFFRNYL